MYAPKPFLMPKLLKFLAFDTSTDRMSVAVTDGVRVWQHSGPGGAQASSTLIPAILALLAQSGLALEALDAIVFGRGPGARLARWRRAWPLALTTAQAFRCCPSTR